jgi:hypothetical protein
LEALLDSPQYQEFQKSPQYRKAEAGRKVVETQLGMDLWAVGQKLLGRQAGIALYPRPGRKEPDAVALVRGADAKALAQLKDRIEPFLALAEEKVERSTGPGDVPIVGVDKKLYFSMKDDWIAAASTPELLTKSLELLAGNDAPSLAADKAFHVMTEQMGGGHLLQLYVNTAAVAEAQGKRLVPEKLDNPLVSLLLGGLLELAVRSPYAGLTLDVEEQRFLVTAAVGGNASGLGESHQGLFSPPDSVGARPLPQVTNLIGGWSLYRDFAHWYRHREDLLEAKLLPNFDKFESGLGNLLPGKSFGEDVLPLFGKRLTFLAAPQDYEHLDGKPGVQLPGFALLVELENPEEGADVFRLFFQTFTAIVNFTAGQQGRDPWIMQSEEHHGVQITFGRYLKKPSGDRLPIVFNFMPASALVGNQFVITSSVGLCRQLIDELKKPDGNSAGALPNRDFNLELHAEQLAAALGVNRQLLEARAVQQGRTAEQAQQ